VDQIPRAPTIPSTFGGDFKRYLLENDMPERLRALKSDLDETSLVIIDRDLEFILNCPNKKSAFAENFLCANENELLLPEEEKILRRDLAIVQSFWNQGAIGDSESLLYEHGLKALPQSVKDYIKSKSFVDGGAWVGDSALVLKKYQPSKIYSFEISQKNFPQLQENTANNRKMIEVFPYALFSHNDWLFFHDAGGESSSLCSLGRDGVKAITLDSFYEERKDEKLGLIKADIEGAEMEMLQGARGVISRDRPVLALCMYHNPFQFFEMKPLLESWNLNYKFKIRKHVCGAHIVETVLIAYPAELEG
jgi:FkbM family methyltransferase